MSDRNVRRVSRFVSDQIWALRESTLDVMVEVLRMRAAGITLSKEEVQARIGAGPMPESSVRGAVAVLPLFGVICPKINAMTEISGGTSLDVWMAQFRQFRDDQSVSAILSPICSPGGSAFMVPEAFDEILRSRAVKPLVAVVDHECGSAALWLGSAFGELVSTPSGETGSLGCFCMHEDWSKANEMMGVKPTYISYGEYKTEGNQDEPLSDEALAYYQARVDACGEQFVKAVAKGRSVPVAKVKSDFGKGRMLNTKEALSVGMIDRIATFNETLARLTGTKGRSQVGARAEKPNRFVVTDEFADDHVIDLTVVIAASIAPDPPDAEEAIVAAAQVAEAGQAEAAQLALQAQADRDLTATALALAGSGL